LSTDKSSKPKFQNRQPNTGIALSLVLRYPFETFDPKSQAQIQLCPSRAHSCAAGDLGGIIQWHALMSESICIRQRTPIRIKIRKSKISHHHESNYFAETLLLDATVNGTPTCMARHNTFPGETYTLPGNFKSLGANLCLRCCCPASLLLQPDQNDSAPPVALEQQTQTLCGVQR